MAFRLLNAEGGTARRRDQTTGSGTALLLAESLRQRRSRESTFQSRLKSRLEALPFSVLLFLVWLKARSLGSERHSFSPVADALLPIPLCSYCCRNFLLGPRLTYILSRQSELPRLQVADMVTLIQVNREPPLGWSSVAALERNSFAQADVGDEAQARAAFANSFQASAISFRIRRWRSVSVWNSIRIVANSRY